MAVEIEAFQQHIQINMSSTLTGLKCHCHSAGQGGVGGEKTLGCSVVVVWRSKRDWHTAALSMKVDFGQTVLWNISWSMLVWSFKTAVRSPSERHHLRHVCFAVCHLIGFAKMQFSNFHKPGCGIYRPQFRYMSVTRFVFYCGLLDR